MLRPAAAGPGSDWMPSRLFTAYRAPEAPNAHPVLFITVCCEAKAAHPDAPPPRFP